MTQRIKLIFLFLQIDKKRKKEKKLNEVFDLFNMPFLILLHKICLQNSKLSLIFESLDYYADLNNQIFFFTKINLIIIIYL